MAHRHQSGEVRLAIGDEGASRGLEMRRGSCELVYGWHLRPREWTSLWREAWPSQICRSSREESSVRRRERRERVGRVSWVNLGEVRLGLGG